MMRELQPVARIEDAICLHEDHDPPAEGCWCGWRLADNLDALRPAAGPECMCVPIRLPPVLARLREETTERADNNEWGIPEDVIHEFDWPAPALVRVRAFGGVRRAEDVEDRAEELEAYFEGTNRNLIREGRGMWRAARVEIVGPIITGQSPDPIQYWPIAGDAAEHYGVPVWVSDMTFPAIFEQVAAGWLPPQPNRAQRRVMERAAKRARRRAV